MSTTERLLLTDADAKSTLAVTRAMGKRPGMRVHVAADKGLALAKWSRFAVKRHLIPPAKTDPEGFVDAIVALNKEWQFNVIMPVADYDIAALLDAPSDKTGELVMALPPREAFYRAWSKSTMMKAAIKAGVPCPETYFPKDEPIEQIAKRAKYPLLIKPDISAGARGITMVSDASELPAKYADVVDAWGPSHLQEFIPQGGGQFKSEIIVGPKGETLALFVCKKLRFYPVEGGSSTLITSQRHPEIEGYVERLAKELGWFGFADFDFVVDPRDGIAKLMECNPRFPESMPINIFAGADFPGCLYELAKHGRAEPVADYEEKRYARFLMGEILWFLNSPYRWKAKPSFWHFWGRDVCYYIQKFDDPGPAFCHLLQTTQTLFSKSQMAYRFERGFHRKTR
jgi:predicted ATP-grasp superfamily ATP-dependent carboligase